MTEEEKRCNTEDILCQMEVLGHLKGIRSIVGDEQFKNSFPEFEGLNETLSERIKSSETNLKETLERCGLLTPGEPLETIQTEEE